LLEHQLGSKGLAKQ